MQNNNITTGYSKLNKVFKYKIFSLNSLLIIICFDILINKQSKEYPYYSSDKNSKFIN
jgi:hypothetical protein